MHIVLVSNCEQAALSRTRTLLDRYGTRIAERTWATLITQEALDELWRALKSTASRHTSVACYRSDAVRGLRLIWVVGNRQAYDVHGRFAVATEQRKRDLALPYRHAALVARLAGYAHDLGKASQQFQNKLEASCEARDTPPARQASDPIRHEWLSAWLFRRLMDSLDEDPLRPESLKRAWNRMLESEGDQAQGPAAGGAPPVVPVMRTALDAVGWAVCTHHGAMGGALAQPNGIDGTKHLRLAGRNPVDNLTLAGTGVAAPAHAPRDAARWADLLHAMDKVVRRLRAVDRPAPGWEGVMLMARAALILADHAVSAGSFEETREEGILYANTKSEPDAGRPARSLRRGKRAAPRANRRLDQPLSWHLRNVGERAASNLRMLAGEALPAVDRGLVQALLSDRSASGSRFAWQDRAAETVAALEGGKLVFDVASTGAGKTLANLKMALAMRPSQTRLAVAFNLRSLTGQTFQAFGKQVKKHDRAAFERDFACLLGERGTIAMDFSKEDEDDRQTQDVLDLEGAQPLAPPPWLHEIAKRSGETDASARERLAKLIAVPVLVCTMDWIVASAEPGEQDRHAKALIRVANSDLILDEVDSYDAKATVAVMRVVQTAASFGRHVIVSSATLNPALAEGLCRAYARGRETYEAMFGPEPWHLVIVGEQFDPQRRTMPTVEAAAELYRDTMRSMARTLSSQATLRRADIADVVDRDEFYDVIVRQARELHQGNASEPRGLSCRLSIGLVRVAQVETCMRVAQTLRESGDFVVTAYHARDVQTRRARREEWLDCILDRNADAWIDALRKAFPQIEAMSGEVRLVVVATPVEEVGRDHDFDWAIIEPSSMHSIVQAAGRVNRHRREALAPGRINVSILSRNLRALKGEKYAFVRPGLETEAEDGTQTTHPSHDMRELLKTVSGEPSEGTLDAGLVFDEGGRQVQMSRYDEAAVRIQTGHAQPVIARSPGFESHFMLEEFASKYPLRADPLPQVYRLDLSAELFYSEWARHGGKESPCGHVSYEPPPCAGVWLTPDLRNEAFSQEKLLLSAEVNRGKPIERIEVFWNGVILS